MSKIFTINSGKIVLSDPCYEVPTWCQGIIENVKNGKWVAEIELLGNEDKYGKRIAYLWAYHLDSAIINPELKDKLQHYEGHPLPFVGGVDSGQFGFFDSDTYRKDAAATDLPKYDFGADWTPKDEDGEEWYRACCFLTLGEEMWGTLPNGVVSISGFGDGSYQVNGIKNATGEYIGFVVEFVEVYEDDFNDDEDDDDED